jgi:hypothetical protein
MARVHFHVIENTPGYMPDSEPAYFRSRVNAGGYALELARELREDGYRVSGNKSIGYQAHRRNDDNDLGRVIEIHDCYEAECYEADGYDHDMGA